jgi:2'-5' RNA ligase
LNSIAADLPYIDNYSLWLLLDDKSTAQCQSVIQRLARFYQSVLFTPHITLAGTPDWSVENINKVISGFISGISSFKLNTTSVRCSSNPYQKLTHSIQSTPELQEFHKKIDETFNGDFAKKEYPHISYLYSRLDCSKISHEIGKIEEVAPRQVFINRLVLVQCKGTPEDWRMLTTWKLD